MHLRVDAVGRPEPDMFWINEETSQATFGSSITIKNATVEDSGTYTFKAKNALGTATAKVELTVACK